MKGTYFLLQHFFLFQQWKNNSSLLIQDQNAAAGTKTH